MRFSDIKNLITRVFAGYTVLANGTRLYLFTTALAVGDSTSAPAGSFAVTSNATGKKQLFISDGSAWQDHGQVETVNTVGTIATTSTTDLMLAAPVTGKLLAAVFIGTDALAQHASNYLTFSLTNLGQDGQSTTAMLAATDANTTKTSTGSALAANTKRELTLNGTAANLNTTKFDRLRFRAAANGTLNNTVTGGCLILIYQRTF